MTVMDRWLKVRSILLPSLDLSGGTHNEDDVFIGICAGHFGLWISECGKAALVTEIISFPRIKVLNCFLGGGSLHALRSLSEPVLKFAADAGCSKIRSAGRQGWARVFAASSVATIVEKGVL